MECKVNKPYPDIKIEEENSYYAKLLYEAYAGMISELTAVTLYSYQRFETFNNDNKFTYIIEQISVVEMKHLEILGKLIKLLGCKSLYIDSNKMLWNADYVIYDTNILDMINTNIVAETEAINYYQKLITKIEDKYIIDIIDRIILDEKQHLKCFDELKLMYTNN